MLKTIVLLNGEDGGLWCLKNCVYIKTRFFFSPSAACNSSDCNPISLPCIETGPALRLIAEDTCLVADHPGHGGSEPGCLGKTVSSHQAFLYAVEFAKLVSSGPLLESHGHSQYSLREAASRL